MFKLNNKAIKHGWKHEEHAIKTYEQCMKLHHINFEAKRCGQIRSHKIRLLRHRLKQNNLKALMDVQSEENLEEVRQKFRRFEHQIKRFPSLRRATKTS